MDRPDIYTDGVRPERCANCGHARTTVFRSVGGGCFKCARPDSDTCGCTASVFKDIKRRIRRLRGEN